MKTLKLLGVWVSEPDKELLTTHAQKHGKTFSKWAGEALLELATTESSVNDTAIKKMVKQQVDKEVKRISKNLKEQLEKAHQTKVKIKKQKIDEFLS